ncbi:MAG: hypothetical protein J0H79_15385 [Alphaproteobacteria bacterium]|nr:hypothetical protein [Alphaproteobacteria bacterium]
MRNYRAFEAALLGTTPVDPVDPVDPDDPVVAVQGVDLVAFGLKGDGSDETGMFLMACAEAWAQGHGKIICTDATRRFKLVDAELTQSLLLDLGGAALVADFNGVYASTCATILKTSKANNVSLTFRNLVIDGQNNGSNPSGAGGHPLLWLNGGALIEFDHVRVVNGANRDNTVFSNIFDYMDGEVQITDARRVYAHDSFFGASPGEILTVQYTGSNPFLATKLEIERCEFSKNKSNAPASQWSSSSIVAYNIGKGSYLRDSIFGQHIKTACNWFGPGVIERCRFEGVSDSQALDFDETEKFGIDQIVVRSCFFQNVMGGYAIRGSARNVIIEDCEINRCQGGIHIARQVGSHPIFTGVGVQGARDLYNVWIKNLTSNGNDVGDGSTVNSLIRVIGVSEAQPIHLYVEGTGVQLSGNHPSANPEYGIWATNCFLYLKGAFQHGRTAMFYMDGFKNVVARDCLFLPQPGATTHLFWLEGGTIDDLVFEDCKVRGALDPGYAHLRFVNAPTMRGKIYRNRSGDLSIINPNTFTLVTNYG